MSADGESAPARPRTAIALAAGLALFAIALVVTLSGSPVAVLHANSTVATGALAQSKGDAGACQSGELLPSGVSAIRLTLASEIGPRVSVKALSGTRLLTSGAVGGGWTGGSVTIPVRPVAHSSGARVCFAMGPSRETVSIVGTPTNAAVAARSTGGQALPGRIRIEYLRAARGSWWSRASAVARRIGLGHAPSGAWVALLVLASMGAVAAAASWLVLKELR